MSEPATTPEHAYPGAPTLRARLTLTILLTILLVLGGSALLLTGITITLNEQAAELRAADRLEEFDTYLSMRADRLILQADNYSEWDEFYEFSASNTRPPDDWLSTELADWLPTRSNVRTVLWTSADGSTIWSMGSAR
ncbi:MAG: hypothetical protein FDZ70_10250, partial [Actinobacteria bacterium]